VAAAFAPRADEARIALKIAARKHPDLTLIRNGWCRCCENLSATPSATDEGGRSCCPPALGEMRPAGGAGQRPRHRIEALPHCSTASTAARYARRMGWRVGLGWPSPSRRRGARGSITAGSPGVGQGATFTIRLPVIRAVRFWGWLPGRPLRGLCRVLHGQARATPPVYPPRVTHPGRPASIRRHNRLLACSRVDLTRTAPTSPEVLHPSTTGFSSNLSASPAPRLRAPWPPPALPPPVTSAPNSSSDSRPHRGQSRVEFARCARRR